jgi:hypothetical protein
LSHAYYHFVQAVGHTQAGHLLHAVPSVLSPRPSFTELARAFHSRADASLGDSVADAAEAAFTAVGIDPVP